MRLSHALSFLFLSDGVDPFILSTSGLTAHTPSSLSISFLSISHAGNARLVQRKSVKSALAKRGAIRNAVKQRLRGAVSKVSKKLSFRHLPKSVRYYAAQARLSPSSFTGIYNGRRAERTEGGKQRGGGTYGLGMELRLVGK